MNEQGGVITSVLQDNLSSNQDFSYVKSILDTHVEWEQAAVSRAIQFIKAVPQVAPPEQDPHPAFSLEFWHSKELVHWGGSALCTARSPSI